MTKPLPHLLNPKHVKTPILRARDLQSIVRKTEGTIMCHQHTRAPLCPYATAKSWATLSFLPFSPLANKKGFHMDNKNKPFSWSSPETVIGRTGNLQHSTSLSLPRAATHFFTRNQRHAEFLSDLIWFYCCSLHKGQLVWGRQMLPELPQKAVPSFFQILITIKYTFQRHQPNKTKKKKKNADKLNWECALP